MDASIGIGKLYDGKKKRATVINEAAERLAAG
jgi:hypothetical protein